MNGNFLFVNYSSIDLIISPKKRTNTNYVIINNINNNNKLRCMHGMYELFVTTLNKWDPNVSKIYDFASKIDLSQRHLSVIAPKHHFDSCHIILTSFNSFACFSLTF